MRNYILLLMFLIIGLVTPLRAYDAVELIGVMNGVTPPSSCPISAMIGAKVCEEGMGFLCVNTPPFSVTEETVNIRGIIDIKNNSFAGITASIQNEYTNEYKKLKFDKLDGDGHFSMPLPLGNKFGPYTIRVTAARANGPAAEEKMRISRVIAPKLTKDDIKVAVNGGAATVSIDILHSCQSCDFVGVSTGGVEATVTNIITNADGGVKKVVNKTNASSGGIISLCMPMGGGSNLMTASVCNAATGYKNCPTVTLDPIEASDTTKGIAWTIPPKDIYNADLEPTVEAAFKLGDTKKSCEENNVILSFNRGQEELICPATDGQYHLNLEPEAGINIGLIRHANESYPFTFGWGEIVSPFEAGGKIKPQDDLAIGSAGGFVLNRKFFTDTMRNFINNFFKSDEFKKMLAGLPDFLDEASSNPPDEEFKEQLEQIKGEIPYCGGAKDEKNIAFKLARVPTVDLIEIPTMELKQDIISLTLNAEDLKIWADVFLDEDENGKPDKKFLPLIIAFKKIFAPIELKVERSGDKPIYLFTGASTDCTYRPKHACTGRPSPLVPKDFIGGITGWGEFVLCDEDKNENCEGVNKGNKKHAIVRTVVLDKINEKLYCDGSAALTYLIRERLKNVPIQMGCANTESKEEPLIVMGKCDEEGLFADRGWIVPIGLDLLNKQFNVNENGIWGTVPAIVGSETFYSEFAGDLKTPEVGFIKRPMISSTPSLAGPGLSSNYDFGIAVGEDFINALLFVLTEQDQIEMKSGLLDWDIHEIFFKKLGFDAVKECDEAKTPSTLCYLRPRVGEILGGALPANGYLSPKHPIMIRLRGNRRLAPRIGFFNEGGRQYLDVQVGNVDISFYALQVDEGNLTLKLGPDGNPIIKSMNPKDSNPDNGPIVRFKLSAKVALELSSVVTDESDPSKFAITIRPEPALSKIVFAPVAGGNATLIPEANLISSLEAVIKLGLESFSKPETAIKIDDLPKVIELDEPYAPDQFSLMGLKKISFGKNGLVLAVEESQEYIDILTKLILTQDLSIDSKRQTFTIPD